MAGHRREQLRAEWVGRLRRFQKRSGNVEEFCRAEGVSLTMLDRWRQRLAGAVPGDEKGTGTIVFGTRLARGEHIDLD
jgi:hypothetical protein